jgi:hypothetical protein
MADVPAPFAPKTESVLPSLRRARLLDFCRAFGILHEVEP